MIKWLKLKFVNWISYGWSKQRANLIKQLESEQKTLTEAFDRISVLRAKGLDDDQATHMFYVEEEIRLRLRHDIEVINTIEEQDSFIENTRRKLKIS